MADFVESENVSASAAGLIWVEKGDSKGDLQNGFEKFRNERMSMLRHKKFANPVRDEDRSNPERLQRLRNKFIENAKKYIGVPYHRRYHEPDSPTFKAPLFLDCCALVRQAIFDMKDELGFSLARWNQAYQVDTLPIKLEEHEMKPGDLIFYEGIYYNKKARPQKHNMVHVEIYLGGESGQASLGARWQKGAVQIFDSYKFVSKSYYDIKFHYRSIDTWLHGVCESVCPMHPWRDDRKVWTPGPKSIFNLDDEPAEEEEDVGNEGAEEDDMPSTNESKQTRRFYVSKGNNWQLVAKLLTARGWEQIDFADSLDLSFDLRWVELRSSIPYRAFKEGKQLVNHIPNSQSLTSKSGLWATVNGFSEVIESTGMRPKHVPEISASVFLPRTFCLLTPADILDLLRFAEDHVESMWIIKPASSNQGRGIKLVSGYPMLCKQVFGNTDSASESSAESTSQTNTTRQGDVRNSPLLGGVVQQYISTPLLINGRKFDIRVYMLIARTKPYLVYFHSGYCRVAFDPYDSSNVENRMIHLTNAAVQRNHPKYKTDKTDFYWSMESLQEYLTAHDLAPPDFVVNQLKNRMKEIELFCFMSAKDTFDKKVGYFDLLGIDFFLDNNLNLFLLEVNTNPSIVADVPLLKSIFTNLLNRTFDVVLQSHGLEDNPSADHSVDSTSGGLELLYDEEKDWSFL
eukprot:GILK01012157.1.p1 GENE.GILK01012157.1~~GILK01012157.1.p1  ORF type:complete len:685 (-),score=132.26 GILK01012157.1:143-2197(-)